MDLQIDDFHKDAAGGLLLLYQAFPRKTALYVEDLIGREAPDEFGLPSKRHQSCLGALLWLAEEGYLRFANTIHYEALDQAVLSEKAFLRLTRIVPRAAAALAEAPASVRREQASLASQHFQWFHFKVEGMAPATEHRFTLVNAGQSAYSHAWSGYQAVASYDGERWFRVPSQYDADGLHFQLEPEESEIRFAYFEPYSRERHARLVERALGIEGVERLAVGTSVQGRDIELLRVRRHPDSHLKLWVIAQQHPGEHMAEWFMEGLIERLQRPDDTEMQRLLEKADLYLVPNMNPDGAFHGNLRTNAAGQDLNRAWLEPSAERSPEVWFVQQEMKRHGVDLFLDIHGDEEIPHVFAAGCEGNPGYTPRLERLEQRFREELMARGEFQIRHGYPRSAPGQANLALACNFVGQTYDCLAFTIEMPFKDHDDNPEPGTGWSGARSKRLGQDVLSTLAVLVDELR